MSRVLVIGCGGVASVAIQKCCQADEVFTELCIASRTKEKCDALARKLEGKTKTVVTTAKVDADDVNQLIQLINSYKPDLVMNIALPYQDLTIMDACLACGVNYMDTANYGFHADYFVCAAASRVLYCGHRADIPEFHGSPLHI